MGISGPICGPDPIGPLRIVSESTGDAAGKLPSSVPLFSFRCFAATSVSPELRESATEEPELVAGAAMVLAAGPAIGRDGKYDDADIPPVSGT